MSFHIADHKMKNARAKNGSSHNHDCIGSCEPEPSERGQREGETPPGPRTATTESQPSSFGARLSSPRSPSRVTRTATARRSSTVSAPSASSPAAALRVRRSAATATATTAVEPAIRMPEVATSSSIGRRGRRTTTPRVVKLPIRVTEITPRRRRRRRTPVPAAPRGRRTTTSRRWRRRRTPRVVRPSTTSAASTGWRRRRGVIVSFRF